MTDDPGSSRRWFAEPYSARPRGPHETELLCPFCGAVLAVGWLPREAVAALGPRLRCEHCHQTVSSDRVGYRGNTRIEVRDKDF
jgi:hypothetical protein